MDKLYRWFSANFICQTIFSNGHIQEPFLTETEDFIHTVRCKRCHRELGFGHYKHLEYFPIPKDFDRNEWVKYCRDNLQSIRDEFKKFSS